MRDGRWFAAAVSAGFLDTALALAEQSPADPHTLLRAARKHLAKEPRFAFEAAFAALRSIAGGWGFDVSALDAIEAATIARDAAARLDCGQEFLRRLHAEEIAGNAFLRSALSLRSSTPRFAVAASSDRGVT